MGNGGYTSLHTDVHLVYDAPSNRFLPGNHVVLTDRATQCLTDFSLDLERSSVLGADGPDLTVQAVTVNGEPASFRFVQPTYPGDPQRPGRPGPAGPPGLAGHPGRRPRPQPAPARLLAAGHRQRRQRPERRAVPGQQARDHPAAAAARRRGLPGVGRLHRPARRAPRRRRLDRGLVPLRQPGRRRWVRHHRAGRHRGLDAAQQPPERQADVRLLRHRERRPYGDRERAAAVHGVAPARRRLPRRLDDVPLALGRAGGQLPGREQRRRLRPHLAARLRRHPLLRGPGQLAQPGAEAGQPRGDGPAAGHHRLPEPVQRPVPVPHRRRAGRASLRPASRRRCRP